MKNLNPAAYFVILYCAKVKWAREIPREMANLERNCDEIVDGFDDWLVDRDLTRVDEIEALTTIATNLMTLMLLFTNEQRCAISTDVGKHYISATCCSTFLSWKERQHYCARIC